jgi:hypothetical protein
LKKGIHIFGIEIEELLIIVLVLLVIVTGIFFLFRGLIEAIEAPSFNASKYNNTGTSVIY